MCVCVCMCVYVCVCVCMCVDCVCVMCIGGSRGDGGRCFIVLGYTTLK